MSVNSSSFLGNHTAGTIFAKDTINLLIFGFAVLVSSLAINPFHPFSKCFAIETSEQRGSVQPPLLAHLELADPSDETQIYAGKTYVWLGRYIISIRISGPLCEGLLLHLSAGAKNDQRGLAFQWIQQEKVLTSGQKSYGGYDGFQELVFEVPATSGETVELRLSATSDKPAFFQRRHFFFVTA